MDLQTSNILKRINFHLKIKKYLTSFSYFFIISGALIYIFYAISVKNMQFKLVNDVKENPQNYQMEKTMINPRVKFQYNDDQIYEIIAKKATHMDEQEVKLFDVFAVGKIGKITAGQLVIEDAGDHLVFTNNPVLILNNQD